MLAIFQDVDATGNYTSNTGLTAPLAAQTGSDTPGSFLWEFGFDPGGTLADGLWITEAPTDVALAVGPGAADFDIGLHQLAGIDIFASHDFMDYTTSLGTAVSFDIEGFGSFGNPPGPDETLPIASDGDFFVLPVPEPTTVAIWSIIAGMALLSCNRRR
jgi:hypothetical protein